jgi:hypothetical protein
MSLLSPNFLHCFTFKGLEESNGQQLKLKGADKDLTWRAHEPHPTASQPTKSVATGVCVRHEFNQPSSTQHLLSSTNTGGDDYQN